jgi:hypothetical protein
MDEQGFAGGCRCGAIRYVLATAMLPPAYACHCLDCQTWSGSAFSEQVVVPEAALSVTGEPVIYELVGASGHLSRQRMCGVCHTRVFNTNTARPGLVVMRAGTLDDSHRLEVAAHIWTSRKQRWVTLPDDVADWPESPPANEFLHAMGRAPARGGLLQD